MQRCICPTAQLHLLCLTLSSSHFYSRYWFYKTSGLKLSPSATSDIIGHVTTAFTIYGFLLTVSLNQPSISHGCRDIEPQRYWGHDLDLSGSRDVISHVAYYRWSFETTLITRTVAEICCVKHSVKCTVTNMHSSTICLMAKIGGCSIF